MKKYEHGKPVEFKGNKCPYGCGRSDCRLTLGSFKNTKTKKPKENDHNQK